MRRAGGTDDDVGAIDRIVELFEGDGFAVELLGQCGGALIRAVAEVDLLGTVGEKMTGSELAHLAGANEIHTRALEVAEYLLGQLDGD